MRFTSNVIRLNELLEGRRRTAYFDGGGVLTIGIGHTNNVVEGQTADDKQIDAWHRQDLMLVDAAIKQLVTVELPQRVIDALGLFIFNVGVSAFARSTMLRKLNAGDLDGAQHELSRWDHDNGKEVLGLEKRRLVEAFVWQGGASLIDGHFINLLLDYI